MGDMEKISINFMSLVPPNSHEFDGLSRFSLNSKLKSGLWS